MKKYYGIDLKYFEIRLDYKTTLKTIHMTALSYMREMNKNLLEDAYVPSKQIF